MSMSHYYRLPGTIRAVNVDVTLEKLSKKLPEIGITRVANITGLDYLGIAVTTCIRPLAKHLSVSQGKGLTPQLAEISAIMEAVETFHMENSAPPEFYGAYSGLSLKYPVLNPYLFNQGHFNVQRLGHLELGWVSAVNLINNELCYVPHILTCLDSTQSRPEYSFFSVSTNGLAAGNSKAEAICHALYELIERDALCHWQSLSPEEKKETQVDLSSVNDANASLILKFQQGGLGLKIWDITSCLSIPAFHCALYDLNLFRNLGLFTGTGAHLSKEVALSRALTEAAQSRLTLISGNRDDIFPEYYRRQQKLQQQLEEQWLNEGTVWYEEVKELTYQPSFHQNIQQVTAILQSKEYPYLLMREHTHPEINIPVIQMIIPGLKFNGARM